MKSTQWLLSGAGCIVGSFVLGVCIALFWLGQMSSFGPGSNLFAAFGILIVFAALTKLLFVGGIVLLVIGFIQMAKEPGNPLEGSTRHPSFDPMDSKKL